MFCQTQGAEITDNCLDPQVMADGHLILFDKAKNSMILNIQFNKIKFPCTPKDLLPQLAKTSMGHDNPHCGCGFPVGIHQHYPHPYPQAPTSPTHMGYPYPCHSLTTATDNAHTGECHERWQWCKAMLLLPWSGESPPQNLTGNHWWGAHRHKRQGQCHHVLPPNLMANDGNNGGISQFMFVPHPSL
jgi:hypothetical protein